MRKDILISETAVRSLIRELLDNDMPAVRNELPAPVMPSPEVDTTYRVHAQLYDVPIGAELVPHDKLELAAALKAFVAEVPDSQVPTLYHKIQRAFDEVSKENEEGIAMAESKKTKDALVEENIRKAVRKLLEAPDMRSALNFSGFDAYGDSDEEDGPIKRVSAKDRAYGQADLRLGQADKTDTSKVTYPQLLKKKHDMKSALSGMSPEERAAAEKDLNDTETREMSHDEMLPFMGHAGTTGVKGEEFKTLEKVRHLANLNPQARKELMDTARDEYIEFLEASGDLEAEEVSLLYSNPGMVEDLEGFRDWLDAYIWDSLESSDPVHYIDPSDYDSIRADKLANKIEPAWPKGPQGEPVHKKGDWTNKQRVSATKSTTARDNERSKEDKGKDKKKDGKKKG